MTDKEAMSIAVLCGQVLSISQATELCVVLNDVCETHQFTVRQPKYRMLRDTYVLEALPLVLFSGHTHEGVEDAHIS
jgi:hypothetical protein